MGGVGVGGFAVTQHCDSDEDDASVAALRALESAIDHARTWRESNARQEGRPAA